MKIEKKSIIKIVVLVLFIITAIYTVKYTNINDFWDKEYLENFISSLGIYGPLVFILLYFIGTIFFFPGTPLTIASGVIFGAVMGTGYTVIGASLGASIAFLISRYLGKDFVDGILKNKFKNLEQYDEKLEEEGLYTMLFLRLIPLFPFNGLNFALGLTKMKFRDFFLGTLIGIIPGSYVLANIGASAADMRGPKFYLFIVLFLLMATVPHFYKKYIRLHPKIR